MTADDLKGIVLAALATAVGMAGLAEVSRIEMGGDAPAYGELRLSLRSDRGRLERCRDRDQAELAALPAHMRTPRACEQRILEYALVVQVDGDTVLDERHRPAGAFGDRPVVVDRHVAVDPGSRAIALRFYPLPPTEWTDVELPNAYALDVTLDVAAGRATLFELDSVAGAFTVYAPEHAGP